VRLYINAAVRLCWWLGRAVEQFADSCVLWAQPCEKSVHVFLTSCLTHSCCSTTSWPAYVTAQSALCLLRIRLRTPSSAATLSLHLPWCFWCPSLSRMSKVCRRMCELATCMLHTPWCCGGGWRRPEAATLFLRGLDLSSRRSCEHPIVVRCALCMIVLPAFCAPWSLLHTMIVLPAFCAPWSLLHTMIVLPAFCAQWSLLHTMIVLPAFCAPWSLLHTMIVLPAFCAPWSLLHTMQMLWAWASFSLNCQVPCVHCGFESWHVRTVLHVLSMLQPAGWPKGREACVSQRCLLRAHGDWCACSYLLTDAFRPQACTDMLERLWAAVFDLLLRTSNMFRDRRMGIIFLIVNHGHIKHVLQVGRGGSWGQGIEGGG